MRTASLTAVTATVARAAFCGRVSADYLASGFLSRPLRLLAWLLRALPGLLRAAVRVGDRFEPGVISYIPCRYPRPGTLGCQAARRIGEPCRFAIAPDQVSGLLGAHGMTVVDLADAEVLRRRYLEATGFDRRHRAQPSYLVTATLGAQLATGEAR